MKKNMVILVTALFLIGCSSQNSEDFYTGDNGNRIEIVNPYSPGTGHYAGYEWAESTGGSCAGNSASFDEGCEEYYRQINSSNY